MTVPSKLPPIGTPLNDCTWEDISKIAASGRASDYFAIGDTKSIHVAGTVGTEFIGNTVDVYIIGFNHNGTENTIDFGTFKDNGDFALVDGNYDSTSTNGTKYFNMNHDGSGNDGGWKGCDMRYDILGSTDVNDGDATPTCATNPVANTLMAALPAELRAVMKPMTIYSDVDGVDNSVDYLPLLAEFEVVGTTDQAYEGEQNYQKQYEYFVSGNSTVKYTFSASSKTAWWWLRSPRTNNSFAIIKPDGTSAYAGASYAQAIAPIFRV